MIWGKMMLLNETENNTNDDDVFRTTCIITIFCCGLSLLFM